MCNSHTCKVAPLAYWYHCFSVTVNHMANACTSQKNNAVKTYLGFLRYRDKEHVILHGVDDD